MYKYCLLLLCVYFTVTNAAAQQIAVGSSSNTTAQYAAQELQRYIFQLTKTLLPIVKTNSTAKGFVIGTPQSNVVVKKQFPGVATATGNEGYSLERRQNTIYITSNTATGCLYGVYGLLQDYYGMGFYLGRDVLPAVKQFYLPAVNETKNPKVGIRGFLPWTNFPQSATVYSWSDWQFIIDQAAKMRMNFINIHNYNGEAGHNEMFHNFSVNGHLSRVWMPTAKTGHGWNCKPFDVKKFQFGARAMFDDYDFGSDVALHNENLDNGMVFKKGVSLFKRVIDYAHSRGVKMALGLDIDLILPEYKTTADDPKVIEARMNQVLQDYPKLDYLVLYISEMIVNSPEKLQLWQRIFNGMYKHLKQSGTPIKIAVSGWGLSKTIADELPEDVIAAPISAYSDGCEDGSMYGSREYWGCPWMERDFSSSEYYYPYNMHLSNTIKAWQGRAKNMTGFYTLTWRLTDAIDPKIAFIANAPWDDNDKFNSSYKVYYDYAVKHYGAKAAATLTDIINENEPLSCNDAECQPTGQFTGKAPEQGGYLLNMRQFGFKNNAQQVMCIGNRYTNINKCAIEKRDDADSCIAWVEDSAYVHFANVDFANGMDTFLYYTATANPYAAFEVFIDGLNGKKIAAVKVPETGGWHNWRRFATTMEPVSGRHDVYVLFMGVVKSHKENAKALQQLSVINNIISTTANPQHRQHMQYLKARIEAAYQHAQLNLYFPAINTSGSLPGLFRDWVKNFTHRVTDISSLGNVQSIQNRYVQERYLVKENELLQKATVKFPTDIKATGITTGAVVSWQNNEPNCKGFNVYANNKKINKILLPDSTTNFSHTANGKFIYQVTAVNNSNTESSLSPSVICAAGNADVTPPYIAIVSPPQSVQQGSIFMLKVRLLDDRAYEQLSVTIFYRAIGTAKWNSTSMQRKANAVFATSIACNTSGVWEYYVIASDGINKATYPVLQKQYATWVVQPGTDAAPAAIENLTVSQDNSLQWSAITDNAAYINIYRSTNPVFTPAAANLLTWLPPAATSFKDNGLDMEGNPLSGTWYYIIVPVSGSGVHAAVAKAVAVPWETKKLP
jgi:hypothetical protein